MARNMTRNMMVCRSALSPFVGRRRHRVRSRPVPGQDDQTPSAPPSSAAVVVPVKSFDLAKGRLADALTPPERADLARSMARRVVEAAHPLAVYVVCGSDEVETWANEVGAEVIRLDQPGLNRAVTHACDVLAGRGYERAIIAHGDLPLARSVGWLDDTAGSDRSTVVIVTDRRGDGTNVMLVPLGTGFEFRYGSGSAAKHRAEAERQGLSWRLVEDPELGWDVDTPDDLAVLRTLGQD
jgi:2-phospho-L-lactate guanylyltransferase